MKRILDIMYDIFYIMSDFLGMTYQARRAATTACPGRWGRMPKPGRT
jgi:hypothetical protein